ncbi:MAG: TolC family protein [Planctomycetota bacterium]
MRSPLNHAALRALAAAVLIAMGAGGARGEEGGAAPDAPPADGAAETSPRALTLEDCLGIARTGNLDVLSKTRVYAKTELDVSSARAAFLPSFSGSASRDNESDTDSATASVTQSTPWGTTVSASITNTNDHGPTVPSESTASITISQPLLAGFGTADGLAGLRKAGLAMDAERARFERVMQEVVYEVKRRYYEAQRQLATIGVREAAVGRAARLLEEAAFKRERGLVTVLDYANAAIQHADREAALVSARRQLEDSLDELKAALNVPLETEITVTPIELDLDKDIFIDTDRGTVSVMVDGDAAPGERPRTRAIFTPAKRDYEETVERALVARPDLAASRLELRSTEIEAARKRTNRLPDLDLSATLAASGSGTGFEDSMTLEDDGWTLALSATWPLGRVARGVEHEKALLDLELGRIGLEKQLVGVRKELRGLFRQLGESEANILTYARKIKAAALGLESARIRKERGQTSYWELTTRESELVNAQTSFINGYLEYQRRLAALERASGVPPEWGEEPAGD